MKYSVLLLALVACFNVIDVSSGNWCYAPVLRPCPAPSLLCSRTECDEGGNCPANAREHESRNDAIVFDVTGDDFGTSDYSETFSACHTIRSCANPCLLSVATGKKYCSGPVGNALGFTKNAGHTVAGEVCRPDSPPYATPE